MSADSLTLSSTCNEKKELLLQRKEEEDFSLPQREGEASEIITKDGDAINYVRAPTEREPVKDGTCLQSLYRQATTAAAM